MSLALIRAPCYAKSPKAPFQNPHGTKRMVTAFGAPQKPTSFALLTSKDSTIDAASPGEMHDPIGHI